MRLSVYVQVSWFGKLRDVLIDRSGGWNGLGLILEGKIDPGIAAGWNEVHSSEEITVSSITSNTCQESGMQQAKFERSMLGFNFLRCKLGGTVLTDRKSHRLQTIQCAPMYCGRFFWYIAYIYIYIMLQCSFKYRRNKPLRFERFPTPLNLFPNVSLWWRPFCSFGDFVLGILK